jgi:chromosome segregation ATPase
MNNILQEAIADASKWKARAEQAEAELARLGENARTAIDAGEVIIGTLRAEKKAAEARAEQAEAALVAALTRLSEEQAACWRPARDIAELRTVIAARDKRIAELEAELQQIRRADGWQLWA